MCYDQPIVKMTKLFRLAAASITLFALLFTQLAVAAYACPQGGPGSQVASSIMMDADMPGCDGMEGDPESPTLCSAHCADPAQSADTPSAPTVPPFIQAALSVVLALGKGVVPVQILTDQFHQTLPGSPAVIIRNCCFRI
jgi:hypothetical protein